MDSLVHDVEELLRHVAEQEILSRFGKLQPDEIFSKSDHGDLVTTADLEAENRIHDGLLKLVPDSVVVGEEGAFKSPEILDKLHGDQAVWVVDPVDGTGNFAKGKACFAVIVALIEGGETQMGWILDPIAGACITTRKGQGTYLEGSRLTINPAPGGIGTMTGSVGEGIRRRLEKKGGKNLPERLLRYRCVGREYMDLVLGKLHFALYGGKMMPWDHAAGALMVAEAGGIARTIDEHEAYSPTNFGHGERLLLAPDEASFEALVPLLTET